MPRLTEQNRGARRAEIVAAARRCFARDGFHRTSMPDVAAEAGLSTGAAYRYFESKEEIVLEVATEAFRFIAEPAERLAASSEAVSVSEVVTASLTEVGGSDDELLRCAVQAWAEVLRHDGLRRRANDALDGVRERMADALRRGQQAGSVAADLDVDRATRVVVALLHGFVLQRVAFGLEDVQGFADDVRAVLAGPTRRG